MLIVACFGGVAHRTPKHSSRAVGRGGFAPARGVGLATCEVGQGVLERASGRHQTLLPCLHACALSFFLFLEGLLECLLTLSSVCQGSRKSIMEFRDVLILLFYCLMVGASSGPRFRCKRCLIHLLVMWLWQQLRLAEANMR